MTIFALYNVRCVVITYGKNSSFGISETDSKFLYKKEILEMTNIYVNDEH